MNPHLLEAHIKAANRQMQRHFEARDYDTAREWALYMAKLISQRSPETVAEMERQKGLANG